MEGEDLLFQPILLSINYQILNIPPVLYPRLRQDDWDGKNQNDKKLQTARDGTQGPKSREITTAASRENLRKIKHSRTQSDRNPAGDNDKDEVEIKPDCSIFRPFFDEEKTSLVNIFEEKIESDTIDQTAKMMKNDKKLSSPDASKDEIDKFSKERRKQYKKGGDGIASNKSLKSDIWDQLVAQLGVKVILVLLQLH